MGTLAGNDQQKDDSLAWQVRAPNVKRAKSDIH